MNGRTGRKGWKEYYMVGKEEGDMLRMWSEGRSGRGVDCKVCVKEGREEGREG